MVYPDYVISLGDDTALVIETKNPRAKLEIRDNILQAHSYASHREVQAALFLLTNAHETLVYETAQRTYEPILRIHLSDLPVRADELRRVLSRSTLVTALTMKREAAELGRRDGLVYYLDGIPYTDTKEVRNGVQLALSHFVEGSTESGVARLEGILSKCFPSPSQRIAILLMLGPGHDHIGRHETALNIFRECLDLARRMSAMIDSSSGNKRCSSVSVNRLYVLLDSADEAYALLRSGESDAFRHCYQETRDLAAQDDANLIAPCNLGGWAALTDRASSAHARHDYLAAHRYANEALNELRRLTAHQTPTADLQRWLEANRAFATALANGDTTLAAKHQDEVLLIDEGVGYVHASAEAISGMGTVYKKSGRLLEARLCFLTSLAIDTEISDQEGIAFDVCALGNTSSCSHAWSNAYSYLTQALELFEELGLEREAKMTQNEIGYVLSDHTYD